MNIRKLIVTTLIISVLAVSASRGSVQDAQATNMEFMKGISFPSYAPNGYTSADASNQLKLVPGLGANWVGIVVTLYQAYGDSNVVFADPGSTPSDSSLAGVIELAHSLGLKVVLKPHLNVLDGTDHQDIQPTDVNSWFESWDQNVVHYARLAAQNSVEMFWIGGELDSMDGYASDWRQIVSDVRAVYNGPLIYGASQRLQHFTTVTWWDAVDYVGIDAYFPLATQTPSPTLSDLNASWTNWITLLNGWQRTVGKPVIFTEIGYSSVVGANQNPAMNIDKIADLPIDLSIQALLYTALFENFYVVPWLRGFLIWFWPSRTDEQGLKDKGFSPQGKPAQDVLTQWYNQEWDAIRNSHPSSASNSGTFPTTDEFIGLLQDRLTWAIALVAVVTLLTLIAGFKRLKTKLDNP